MTEKFCRTQLPGSRFMRAGGQTVASYRPIVDLDRDTGTMLKGIAILLVMLGHLGYVNWGGAGGVMLFLIVSGYGLNTSCTENGIRGYWRKRIVKVWLPYVFVGIFDVFAFGARDPKRILFTVVGLDFGLIVDRTMWYISFILYWYLAYYLLYTITYLFRKYRFRGLICAAGLLPFACVASLLYFRGVWSPYSGALYYVLGFPIGVLMSEFRKLQVREITQKAGWSLLLFCCAAYLFRFYLAESYGALHALAMASLPIAVLHTVPARNGAKAFLMRTGQYSYPLYLFEGIILRVRDNWFYKMGNPVLIDLCALLVTGIMAYVYWEAYQKLSDRLL